MTAEEIEQTFQKKIADLLSEYKEALNEKEGKRDDFTVKSLIKALETFPPNHRVLFNDSKYGPSVFGRVSVHLCPSGEEKGEPRVLLGN